MMKNESDCFTQIFELYGGKFKFIIFSANGKELAESSQTYSRKSDAIRGVRRVIPGIKVKEVFSV